MAIDVRDFASKVSDAIPLAMEHYKNQNYILTDDFQLPGAPGVLRVPPGQHELDAFAFSRRCGLMGTEELGKSTVLRIHPRPVTWDPVIHTPGDWAGDRSRAAILMADELHANNQAYPRLSNLAIVNADPAGHPDAEGIQFCGGTHGRIEHVTLANFRRSIVFDGTLNTHCEDVHFALTGAAAAWPDADIMHFYIAAPVDRENGFLEGYPVLDNSVPNNLSFSHCNHNARGVAYRIDSGVNHTVDHAHFGTGVYRVAEFRGRCQGVHFDLGNYTERLLLDGTDREYFLIRHKEDNPTQPQYPAKRLSIRTGWNSIGGPAPVPAFVRVGNFAIAEQLSVEDAGFIGTAEGGQIKTEGTGLIQDLRLIGNTSESGPVVHPDANVQGQVIHITGQRHPDGSSDPRIGLGTAFPEHALDVKHAPDKAGYRFYYDPPGGTGRPPQEYAGVQVGPYRTSVRDTVAMGAFHTHPNSVRGHLRETRDVQIPKASGPDEWNVIAEMEIGQKGHGLLNITIELIRGSTTHLGTWVYLVPVARWDAAQPTWGGLGPPHLVHHGDVGNDPDVQLRFSMDGWKFVVECTGDVTTPVNGTIAISGMLGNG